MAQDKTAETSRCRECDCPDWVIRCAHWDGRILVLAPNSAHAWGPTCKITRFDGFCVWAGTHYEPGGCANPEHLVLPTIDEDWAPHWMPWPEAQAEFARREALLLGREPSDA